MSTKEEPTSCFDLEDYIKETKKEELKKSEMKDDLKNSSCDEEVRIIVIDFWTQIWAKTDLVRQICI